MCETKTSKLSKKSWPRVGKMKKKCQRNVRECKSCIGNVKIIFKEHFEQILIKCPKWLYYKKCLKNVRK